MDQTWTDLNSPTKDEVDSLMLSQNIDISVAKDLLTPTPKQYASASGSSIYAVLHIPCFQHSVSLSTEQEIDFIISRDGLITTRYDSIDAMHHFAKKIEVNEVFHKGDHSHIFFGLMKEIYGFLFNEIEYIKDWIKEIEKNIFEGYEKEMVFGISAAGRSVLTFKRILGPHQHVIVSLHDLSKDIFDDNFRRELMYLMTEWERLNLEINNISEMLDELRETNNSILSTKQNEIMKTFTILAFVTFPLSLIATIFGMNSKHIPLVGQQYDFWIILGFMFGVSLAMFSYFKYKKWI